MVSRALRILPASLLAAACLMAAAAAVSHAAPAGTLLIRLETIKGGPRHSQGRPVTVTLRLTVSTPSGRTVRVGVSRAGSGAVVAYRLPPGSYRVQGRMLPPVVNPARECVARAPARVRAGVRTVATLRCVLIG